MKHNASLTCEQYKEWKADNDIADVRFAEVYSKLKWAKCPHCQFNTEKIEGCNFMTCMSKYCLGKNYYCYLCSNKLDPATGAYHFNGQSTYSNICVNTVPEG